MRTFTVKALSVAGNGKKIFKSKDVVTEDQFPEGTIDQLVKDGFLKEIFEKPTTSLEDFAAKQKAEDDLAEEKRKAKALLEAENSGSGNSEETGKNDSEENEEESEDSKKGNSKKNKK